MKREATTLQSKANIYPINFYKHLQVTNVAKQNNMASCLGEMSLNLKS